MDLGIAGKVALVTAGSRGLGRATALALVAEGARVLVSGRQEGSLAAVRDDLAVLGGEVEVLAGDVTDPEEPARLVHRAVDRFGGLDILVANAGGPPPGRALDLSDDALAAALNANFVTSVRLVREAVPHMRAAGWGRIACITSYTIVQPAPCSPSRTPHASGSGDGRRRRPTTSPPNGAASPSTWSAPAHMPPSECSSSVGPTSWASRPTSAR